MAACTSCSATSMLRSSANWSVMTELPKELVDTLQHDHPPSGDPRVDRGLRAPGRTDGDRTHLDRVVRLHHVDEGAACAALDRGDRHDHGAAFHVEQQVHVHELVGEEDAVG